METPIVPARPGETILLVDDEAGIVSLAADVLSRYGHVVRTAASADDALNPARTRPPGAPLLQEPFTPSQRLERVRAVFDRPAGA